MVPAFVDNRNFNPGPINTMSLRTFHIVFVTVSTLLFVFLAVWAFGFAKDRSAIITALGGISAVAAVAMPVYGAYFYKKVRNIVL